jgi:uncharacterized protein (TIGR03089 family)
VTPAQLLARAVVDDPARPLITFYDDATGERAELSVVTFGNWVAKTANLLVDGLGAQPGQRVALDLPVHWQGAVWHAACWVSGLVTMTGAGAADAADIAVLALDGDGAGERAAPQAAEVVGLGLGPLGLPRRDRTPPDYVTVDYDREIHGHGDRFPFTASDQADRPALETDSGAAFTAGELGAETDEHLRRWASPTGSRILSGLPYRGLLAVVSGLLAPLANAGGAVLCRRPDRARLATRAQAEHVTSVTGLPGGVLPGLPRLT